MFDTLYVMVKGQVGYFGPVDRIATYFRNIGYAIPAGLNPADFIIDLTHGDESVKTEEAAVTVEDATMESKTAENDIIVSEIVPPPPRIPLSRSSTNSLPAGPSKLKIDLVRKPGGSRMAERKTRPPRGKIELKLPPISTKGLVAAQSERNSRRSSVDTNLSAYGAASLPDSNYMIQHLGPIRHSTLNESYLKSSLGLENDAELANIAIIESEGSNGKKQTRAFAISLIAQSKILITRSHLNSTRNPGFHVSWIVGGISFLFYGLIYLGLRTSSLVEQIETDHSALDKLVAFEYWDSQRAFIFQLVSAIVFLQLETLTTGMQRSYPCSTPRETIILPRICKRMLLYLSLPYIVDSQIPHTFSTPKPSFPTTSILCIWPYHPSPKIPRLHNRLWRNGFHRVFPSSPHDLRDTYTREKLDNVHACD
jgi:hypothetical protein